MRAIEPLSGVLREASLRVVWAFAAFAPLTFRAIPAHADPDQTSAMSASQGEATAPNAPAPAPAVPLDGAATQAQETAPLILPRATKRIRNWKRHDDTLHGPSLRGIGLRAGLGAMSTGVPSQQTEHPISMALVERGMGLLDFGLLDARYLDELGFGRDSQGWTYRLDAQLSMGPRWRWSQSTAGVLRLGGRAHMARFVGVYSSDVRAPSLSAGLRHESSNLHVDAVVEYAPVLAGHFEPPNANYSLGGSQAGAALLSVSWDRLHLDAELAKYWRDSAPHSVYEGSVWGCVNWRWGLLCIDGRVEQVPASGANSQILAFSGGFSALVGKYEWLHSD